jgi:hypothetical protein
MEMILSRGSGDSRGPCPCAIFGGRSARLSAYQAANIGCGTRDNRDYPADPGAGGYQSHNHERRPCPQLKGPEISHWRYSEIILVCFRGRPTRCSQSCAPSLEYSCNQKLQRSHRPRAEASLANVLRSPYPCNEALLANCGRNEADAFTRLLTKLHGGLATSE